MKIDLTVYVCIRSTISHAGYTHELNTRPHNYVSGKVYIAVSPSVAYLVSNNELSAQKGQYLASKEFITVDEVALFLKAMFFVILIFA